MKETNTLEMQTAKVMYVYGVLSTEDENFDSLEDLDDIYFLCESIAQDWIEGIDIQNNDEQGYISNYASRKLMEG